MKNFQRYVSRFIIRIIIPGFFIGLFLTLPVKALNIKVVPAEISVNFGYHGSTLTVTGQGKDLNDLVIKVSNPSHDVELKYMDKVGGIFWMKKGMLKFLNLPGVYMVFSTAQLNKIISDKTRLEQGIGYEDLLKSAKILDSQGKEADKKWLKDFLSLKEHEKLYIIEEGTIKKTKGQAEDSFQLSFKWPYQAAPGKYEIKIYALKDGNISDSATASIQVTRTGLVAAVSEMARDHAALYGLMAIVIALAAGLLVGVIFKKGGEGGH